MRPPAAAVVLLMFLCAEASLSGVEAAGTARLEERPSQQARYEKVAKTVDLLRSKMLQLRDAARAEAAPPQERARFPYTVTKKADAGAAQVTSQAHSDPPDAVSEEAPAPEPQTAAPAEPAQQQEEEQQNEQQQQQNEPQQEEQPTAPLQQSAAVPAAVPRMPGPLQLRATTFLGTEPGDEVTWLEGINWVEDVIKYDPSSMFGVALPAGGVFLIFIGTTLMLLMKIMYQKDENYVISKQNLNNTRHYKMYQIGMCMVALGGLALFVSGWLFQMLVGLFALGYMAYFEGLRRMHLPNGDAELQTDDTDRTTAEDEGNDEDEDEDEVIDEDLTNTGRTFTHYID